MSIWGEGSRVGVAVHADANNLKPSLKFVAKPRLDYVPSSIVEDAIDRFVRAVLESVGDASDGLGTEYRQPQSERTEPSAAAWRKLEAMLGFDPDVAPDGLVPPIPSSIPIASRDGIDLDPVDLANPDQLLWLRALIWPEHLERHQQLIDAAAEFEHSDIRMHAGNSSRVLPALIETIPPRSRHGRLLHHRALPVSPRKPPAHRRYARRRQRYKACMADRAWGERPGTLHRALPERCGRDRIAG